LRGDQRGASRIEQGQIHLSISIGKNSQIRDFLGKIRGRFRIVRAANAQQNHQTRADFSGDTALNGNAGAGNTLNDSSHNSPPPNGTTDAHGSTRINTNKRQEKHTRTTKGFSL
jgi:hypothetical protein